MIKKVLLYTVIYICMALPALAGPVINVVYPEVANKRLNSTSIYFIGNTTPGSSMSINGSPVTVHKKGIFVKDVPLKRGKNYFTLVSTKNNSTTKKTYIVRVPYPEKSYATKPLKIATHTVKPKGVSAYSTGDIINVSFKGSPGGNASFAIGNSKPVPMTELPPVVDTVSMRVLGEVYGMIPEPVKGYYNGIYEVKATDKFNNQPIKIHLSDGKGKTRSVVSASKVSAWKPFAQPRVAEVIKEKATVRTGPGDSRLTPLKKGTRIHLSGALDGYYKYKMGPINEGFIPQSNVRLLPKGTPIPFSEIKSFSVKKGNGTAFLVIPISEILPLQFEQAADQKTLSVFLYGARANTDIIHYNVNDNFIDQVKWSQPQTKVYQIDIVFNKNQQWGYDYYYKGSKARGDLELIIKIKYPPAVNVQAPLKDKIIVIDPGHGGYEKGSKGFGFLSEKDINLTMSLKLAKMLEGAGARPILTRYSDKFMAIYPRTDFADSKNAHILISIHNNAIPDGRDPNVEHGSSSYYYHPMSFNLAKSIQKNMLEQLQFPDFGLYFDNLAIPRDHRMPSVLIEVGFMINPEEYLLLETPEFQTKSASAIFDGIKQFFIKTR